MIAHCPTWTRVALAASLLITAAVHATESKVRVTSAEELTRELREAKPGTVIELAPGRYGHVFAENVHGTAEAPIRVVAVGASPNSAPPVFTAGMQFSEASHLELAGFVIEGAPGNGLNIDDAGTFDTPTHHLVLRDLIVRDCGRDGNEDGIKLSGVNDFTLVGCTIERWGRRGSGIDMVGCARGTIETTTLRDREELLAASGIQAKGGSREVTIRSCRFEHAGERAVNLGGSTGRDFFRPKLEGFEAKDIVVEGCRFVGSLAPIAFVGIDGATVRYNTIVEPRKWVVRILQESTGPDFVPCRGGVFTRNLVVFRSANVREIRNIGPGTAPETFRFDDNFWFASDEPSRSLARVREFDASAVGGVDPGSSRSEETIGSIGPDSPAKHYGADAFRLR